MYYVENRVDFLLQNYSSKNKVIISATFLFLIVTSLNNLSIVKLCKVSWTKCRKLQDTQPDVLIKVLYISQPHIITEPHIITTMFSVIITELYQCKMLWVETRYERNLENCDNYAN